MSIKVTAFKGAMKNDFQDHLETWASLMAEFPRNQELIESYLCRITEALNLPDPLKVLEPMRLLARSGTVLTFAQLEQRIQCAKCILKPAHPEGLGCIGRSVCRAQVLRKKFLWEDCLINPAC